MITFIFFNSTRRNVLHFDLKCYLCRKIKGMKTNFQQWLFIAVVLSLCANIGMNADITIRKREFRGAWIQCVNEQFQGLSPDAMRQNLTRQLDELQKAGVNAIIFQVRPECDALYKSDIEPWSRFLTGRQGVAPNPLWDPLQWMICECHERGMELHAWINPYRAKTKGTTYLDPSNVAIKHPDRVFSYDGQLILNPGNPLNREYICKVVDDIVRRYDIDGMHIDDYFYPYPVAGQVIPDRDEFNRNSNGIKDLGDWRRDNVNVFIKQLSDSIKSVKPWVKFGVAPFGIYRNKKSAPTVGSDTNGLQNYDDLYADVLLWVNNGWVDYCVPQVYWQIGNKAADYKALVNWWNKFASNRPIYIGEDVERTVKYPDLANLSNNQMAAKFALRSGLRNINGVVLWYSKLVADNYGNYGSNLRNYYWRYPALQSAMTFIDKTTPKKPKSVKPVWTSDGYILFWGKPKVKKWGSEARKFVVYRFAKGDEIDIDNPTNIVGVTYGTSYKLPYVDGKTQYTYVVTSLNRVDNESKGVKKKVRL